MELVERIAALDVGKGVWSACIRVPHENIAVRRRQELGEYVTTTKARLRLADRMRAGGPMTALGNRSSPAESDFDSSG
jgi:hypothetical protein